MNDERIEITDEGRLWALASYAGFFFGVPVGLVPMILRKDAYALHHGKVATAVYLSSLVVGLLAASVLVPLSLCTFGLLAFVAVPAMMTLALWPLVTAIHGIVIVLNGEWTEPIGGFGLADRLFASVRLLEDPPPPPPAVD